MQKVRFILFKLSHSHAGDHEYCEACGQRLPPPGGVGYGAPKRHNRVGIGISVALHLLVALYILFQPKQKIVLTPPAKEGEMVWVAPLPKSQTKPTPKAEPKKTETAQAKPKAAPRRDSRAVARKDAPPKLETYVPPVQATMKPPPTPVTEDDLQARIEARRKARGEAPQPEPQESEAERGNRVARANIMGAQGRNANGERNDTGGVFQVMDKTSFSAQIKFRGWNTNFKRNWSQNVKVELGTEIDIETAIVKQMIELIRKEKPGDFVWESHRLGRNVPLNAGRQYQGELEAFLLKEFFPDYRR